MAIPDIQGQFGTAVRARRKRLGISQEELAGRAGLHRTYVSDIERGARNPSLESIDKLARALKISVAKLFSSSDKLASATASDELVDILLVEDNADDVHLTLAALK